MKFVDQICEVAGKKYADFMVQNLSYTCIIIYAQIETPRKLTSSASRLPASPMPVKVFVYILQELAAHNKQVNMLNNRMANSIIIHQKEE